MSQQINLLNPSLIEQKDYPNLAMMTISVVILLSLILANFAYVRWQSMAIDAQHDALALELFNMQEQVNTTAANFKARDPDINLVNQIKWLTKKHNMQATLLSIISVSGREEVKLYSDMMRGFAEQKMPGLWLTGFNIDSSAETMTINGRALKAEIVPLYLSQLGKTHVFRGQEFTTLDMHAMETTEDVKYDSTILSPDIGKSNDSNNQLDKSKKPLENSAGVKIQAIAKSEFIEFVLKSDKKVAEQSSVINTVGEKP